ncbi:phosphatases II [Gigaspora margarita]|uniref:Phosphatases II n=2 Tax=Gigaspora margarita TaxID=4874 RepID=A0A8H4A082_GIGMA|nr:phosphatases II [Gigaspora margarita]
MDLSKIIKVENILLERGRNAVFGTLYLTTHQMIFRSPGQKDEICILYPLIHTVERRPPTTDPKVWPLTIRCRDFNIYTFSVEIQDDATDVFNKIQKLTCIGSIKQVYAFEHMFEKKFPSSDGWSVYDVLQEYDRMGVDNATGSWRFSNVNRSYTFCATYPRILVVPAKISDNVLNHASKFRSKNRIPVLSYLHWHNKASITRSSQPMVGLKQNRSIQDEKLIEAIFRSNIKTLSERGSQSNLIIDARPTANAMVNVAMGAGTENVENYKNCERKFMGIDNIHVMRESLGKMVDVIHTADANGLPIKKHYLDKSGWLRHISTLLESALVIIKNVHIFGSHVLVHCSDGWDRTVQLTSISELCLDPYYRTFRGFQVLIEKEWVSFGHKFSDRSGHLSNEKYFINTASSTFNSVQSKFSKQSHVREISPVFHQFLDCVFQILSQFPTKFEFNENFLIKLHYHCYSCQFGTFLCNSEKERMDYKVTSETYSVWNYFNSHKEMFINPLYNEKANPNDNNDDCVLFPDEKIVKYWAGLFGKHDEELNGNNDEIREEKVEGFAARIRWRSNSPISRPASPNVNSIVDGNIWKDDTPSPSLPFNKHVKLYEDNPYYDPWKNNSNKMGNNNFHTVKDRSMSNEASTTKDKLTNNDFNTIKDRFMNNANSLARATISIGTSAYYNVTSLAKSNFDLGINETTSPVEITNNTETQNLREMESFSALSLSENSKNNNSVTSNSNVSTLFTESRSPRQSISTNFSSYTSFGRRESFPSLGIKPSSVPSSPSSRVNSPSSDPTSPLSSTSSRSNSLSKKFNSESKVSSPLSTPPISSPPATTELLKDLPHPLYNVDVFSSP